MAKQTQRKRRIYMSRTYQAICREGDFTGNVHTDEGMASAEGNAHQNEPGKMSHVVDVVGTAISRVTLRAAKG